MALKEILVHAEFSSFGELPEKPKVRSSPQASKPIAIARSVPRAEAIEVGSEKAYELVRLTEQTAERETVGDLLASERGAR